MIEVSWTSMKANFSAKGLYPTFFEDGNIILIFPSDKSLPVFCRLNKSVQSDDLTDFETNYRTLSSQRWPDGSIAGGGVEGAISVTNSATEAKVGGSRLTGRSSLCITNMGTATIYFGYTSGVTTSSGSPIYVGERLPITVSQGQAIYLIAASGSHDTRILEAK